MKVTLMTQCIKYRGPEGVVLDPIKVIDNTHYIFECDGVKYYVTVEEDNG